MTHVEIRSRVGSDGVLTVSLPLGPGEANREVRVMVEPAESADNASEQWRDFIATTAGCIADPTFQRPEQGPYEQRGEVFP